MAELATIAAVVSAVGAVASTGLALMQASAQASAQRSQAAMLELQSRQQELEARGVELRGQNEALDTREALFRTLATQNARYSAAGVVIGEGTAETVAERTRAEADRQLEIQRTNTEIAAASARLGAGMTSQRALLLRDDASATATAGALGAFSTFAQGAMRVADRWPGQSKSGGAAPRTSS